MDGINSRIAELIRSSGETKSDWARKLNVTPQFISSLCAGKKTPSDRTIKDICREFSVNEKWLRAGEGEMLIPTTRSQEIADFVGDILKGEEDNFKRRFVAMLARLDDTEWEFIERKALELFENAKKG